MIPVIIDRFKKNAEAFLTGIFIGVLVTYMFTRMDMIYLVHEIKKANVVSIILSQSLVNKNYQIEEEKMKFNKLYNELVKESDPQADVRTRGTVVFDAKDADITDDADHFPINDADQARNALSRASQSDFSWYKGTKEEGIAKIKRAVKKAFPSIDVTD